MPPRPEKRKYDRLEVADFHLKATLAVIAGSRTEAHLIVVKNVSKDGIGAYLKTPLKPGTQFRISVEGFSHLPLPGKVNWCGPVEGEPHVPASHPFAAGLSLTPQDDETRENQISLYQQIESFIKRKLGQ